MLDYQSPFVSVIIPTYNRRHTLPASIDSVLMQTYENLELIIVDDGSDDGTEEYVRTIKDDRVKYVRTKSNKGPSAARNLGAGMAGGEYLAFHDSDDEWMPDKLEKQMALFADKKAEIAMVYCEYTKYNGSDWLLVPTREIPFSKKQGDIFSYLLLQPLIGTPTMVVLKEEFLKIGGFDESLLSYEDYEFTLRFSKEHRIGFVEEPLVKVNQSVNSVNKRLAERICAQFYMISEMLYDLKERGLLWIKLELVLREAVKLKCHNAYMEELYKLGELPGMKEEQQGIRQLLQKIEHSDEKINESKLEAYDKIIGLKQQALKVYLGIYGNEAVQPAALRKMQKDLQEGINRAGLFFTLLPECVNESRILSKKEIPGQKEGQLFWITELVKVLEELEKSIGKSCECNVCRNDVYFKADGECPICKAQKTERLMIAFMDELQPESGEKLKMLQIEGSDIIKNYSIRRPDFLYGFLPQSASVDEKSGETYDIVICREESAEDIGEIKKLYRILRATGVLIFSILPAESDKMSVCVKNLKDAGFDVSLPGREWFGDDFCVKHGFDEKAYICAAFKPIGNGRM